MSKKIIVLIVAVMVVVVAAGAIVMNNKTYVPKTDVTKTETPKDDQSDVAENTAPAAVENDREQPVKEFTMESFVKMVDGEPKPQYSVKEITVNKGDLVRIKITVTVGMHDFKIDEFNVYEDTQLNKENIVEFTADKAGEFIYYCTKPGHRQNGHWGTLKVLE